MITNAKLTENGVLVSFNDRDDLETNLNARNWLDIEYQEWLKAGNEPEAYVAPEPLPPTGRELKLEGVDFEGVMCSATKEDMWGLSAVEGWVIAGNDTPFNFENGSVLILTAENYAAFRAIWIPFRAGFF